MKHLMHYLINYHDSNGDADANLDITINPFLHTENSD